VAKKKPPVRGVGRLVRIDPSLWSMARVVATTRGIGLGDYISSLVRSSVSRDYVAEVKRVEKEGQVK
jgi:hypothetical protein